MVKLLIKLLLITPVLLVVSIVNIYSDPASVFGKGYYELEAANLLMENDIEHTKENYNERLLKKYYFENMDEKKSIIVLGSSRSMIINSNHLHSQYSFNASVSGAVLQDIIGLTEVLYDQKKLPDKIIIGIDPWMFNKNNGEDRWKNGLENEYNKFHNRGNDNNSSLKPELDIRAKTLLSPPYYQESVKEILHNIRLGHDENNNQPSIAKELVSEKAIMKIDGSIIYPKSMQNLNEKETSRSAYEFISSSHIYQLDNFSELDVSMQNEFESYLEFLNTYGIRCEFFLAPYHPIAYYYFKDEKKYEPILQVEKYVRNLAKERNITVRGSYDPDRMDLLNIDYYDAMHLREESIENAYNYIEK